MISQLAESYFSAPPTKLIFSALWYLEAAFRSYYVDYCWPLLVTGLEAVVHIWNENAGSTKVFKRRLSQISEKLSDVDLDVDALTKIYDKRSILVHGAAIDEVDAETRGLLFLAHTSHAGTDASHRRPSVRVHILAIWR